MTPNKVACHIFSMPGRSLEQLKLDAVGSTKVELTNDDVVHALLWRCIMRSRYPEPGEELSEYQIAFDGAESCFSSLLTLLMMDMAFGGKLFANGGIPDYVRPER